MQDSDCEQVDCKVAKCMIDASGSTTNVCSYESDMEMDQQRCSSESAPSGFCSAGACMTCGSDVDCDTGSSCRSSVCDVPSGACMDTLLKAENDSCGPDDEVCTDTGDCGTWRRFRSPEAGWFVLVSSLPRSCNAAQSTASRRPRLLRSATRAAAAACPTGATRLVLVCVCVWGGLALCLRHAWLRTWNAHLVVTLDTHTPARTKTHARTCGSATCHQLPCQGGPLSGRLRRRDAPCRGDAMQRGRLRRLRYGVELWWRELYAA